MLRFAGKVIWMTLIHSWTFLFQVLTPFCKCALLLTTLNMDLERSAFSHYLCEKEDYGVVGLRYGSENLSVGAALMPLASKYESPKHAWLVSKMGRLTVDGSKDGAKYKNLMNWSAAVGYGVGSGSPLSPSFNFSLELAKTSQFIASFYQHVVVQRRVKNPLEENEIVGITNYIDFGFELQTRVDDPKTSNNIPDSTFQAAASWQANKNFLLKYCARHMSVLQNFAGKGWTSQLNISICVQVMVETFLHLQYFRDRIIGKTSYGFGIRIENLREASYQRADPNFVMLTPSKEHLAEGIIWKIGKRPMLQSDVNAGNFDGLPRELRPLGKIL
ncbi:hypothetical protein NC651_003499 [Populus alba x Populus x berolinensis]|nr:hypothetical protein NC651_003499 [Populus alba x Populus x berolinensis]